MNVDMSVQGVTTRLKRASQLRDLCLSLGKTKMVHSKSDLVDFRIEKAVEADVPLILSFIKELADYERLSHEVVATEEMLRDALFGERPAAEVVIAYDQGEAVGFALFFHSFSTFVGRQGLYLEDLYVRPAARGKGIGRAMLVYLARLAKERGCGRFEWAVLDWNEPAIKFYQSLGAVPMEEWTVFRLAGEALDRVAGEV